MYLDDGEDLLFDARAAREILAFTLAARRSSELEVPVLVEEFSKGLV